MNATTIKKNLTSTLRDFPGLIEEGYVVRITTKDNNLRQSTKSQRTHHADLTVNQEITRRRGQTEEKNKDIISVGHT